MDVEKNTVMLLVAGVLLFYVETVFCEGCPHNCAACTDSNTCSTCKDGFYNGHLYDDNRHNATNNCTLSCVPECESCTSYKNCLSCKAGYCISESNRTCKYRCQANCNICTSCERCTSCKTWYYGASCDRQCASGCTDGECNIDNGRCNCTLNFEGEKCEICSAGRYGVHCDRKCSRDCINNVCDRKIGSCSYASHVCQAGHFWQGHICEECPLNCVNCSSTTTCSQCTSRFWGTLCDNPCPQHCAECSSRNICSLCDNGFYGQLCSRPCPGNCEGSKCAKDSGECFNCRAAFTGAVCNACKDGTWGDSCQRACSTGCSSTRCNLTTGSCATGCREGFTGSTCDTCIDGRYRNKCKQCPVNCESCTSKSKCSICKSTWWGNKCHHRCPVNCVANVCSDGGKCHSCASGYYGFTCNRECPMHCRGKCFIDNGHCHSCIDGYYGFTCNRECPMHCRGKCFIDNGHCHSCIDGYYGDACENKCPINCSTCSSESNCTLCKPGQTGKVCDTECKNCKRGTACGQLDGKCADACADGLYGILCDLNCSPNCKTCDRTYNFRCISCAHGKYDSGNRYSSTYLMCTYNCSRSCLLGTCHETNGLCSQGCVKGYWGKRCQHECGTNCLNGHCFIDNGTCIEGCITGFYGQRCSRPCIDYDKNCVECSTSTTYRYAGCLMCEHRNYPSLAHGKPIWNKRCISCPVHCAHEDCNATNGSCLSGCTDGRWGIKCEHTCTVGCLACTPGTGECTVCVDGRYSHECAEQCSPNCNMTNGAPVCGINGGECVNGCAERTRHGAHCDQECNVNCLDQECNVATGACIRGCIHGYNGEFCIQATIPASSADIYRYGVVAGPVALTSVVIVLLFLLFIRWRIMRRQVVVEDEDIVEMKRNMEGGPVSNNLVIDGHIEDTDAGIIYAIPDKTRTTKSRGLIGGAKGQQNEESQCTEGNIAAEPMVVDDANKVRTYASSRWGVTKEEAREETDDMGKEEQVVADNAYYNTAEVLRRRVTLDRLKQFVSKKTKEDYATEFSQFPAGLIKPYIQSQKKVNISKNRYRGIYPYDARRVVLQEGQSDYINASYIDGYKKVKAYIASIGPTVDHMGDFSVFWRMILQERVGIIVMLTNLKELGVSKCDKYWPNSESSELYDDVMVTCQSEIVYTDYTKRVFIIEKSSERRTVYHMHFTSWPDKRTPDKVSSLAEFRQNVNSITADCHGPIVVHCSAGVGRTGTYLALDMLTNEGVSEGYVDILACVRNLREERVNMVQTLEQYKYLHEALVYLLATDKEISSDNKNASESNNMSRIHRH